MATGWPMKTTYADGDVYSASDVNDITGTINLLGQSVTTSAGKNAIINGGFDVWQRGTSFTTSGAYTADRWAEVNGANSIIYTRSTDVPSSLGFQYSISRAGTGSNMVQRIEAANAARFAGQTVTLSFYYKSTAGADFLGYSMYYANSADSFGSVTQIGSNQTIATPATSWTRVTYSFSVPAGGANGLAFYFFRGSTATSTTLITGVQLELGSTATTFSRAGGTIQGELAACQRYYWRTTGTSAYQNHAVGFATNTTDAYFIISAPSQMRVVPTAIDYTQQQAHLPGISNNVFGTVTISGDSDQKNITIFAYGASGLTTYRPYFLANNNNAAGYIGLSAEL